MNDTSPYAYAKSIAYLGDASTIQARTRDFFGWSPSIDVCKAIVERRAKEFSKAADLADARDREYRRELEREASRRYRQRKAASNG